MTTIKNHLMTLRTDDRRVAERDATPTEKVNAGSAVAFDREGSQSHRLYERTRLEQERERAEHIARIKKAVENGTYRPNLDVVAERLAADLRGGRHL